MAITSNSPTSWHSYPQIYNLGHKAIAGIFDDDVLIEEKIDGSQFSFGRGDALVHSVVGQDEIVF